MAVWETMTFRLSAGVHVADLLAADERLQSEFADHQPGLLRRTTASGVGERAGEWIVVDVWETAEAADACAARWDDDPAAQAFMALVDRATVDVRRYVDRR